MRIWEPIDRLGYVLATRWTPVLQVRTGTLLTIAGLVLVPIGIYVGFAEGTFDWLGFLIYEMSAVALVQGGMNILETAILAVQSADDIDESDLLPDDERGDDR